MDNSIAVANVLTVKALSGVTFLALAKLVELSSWEAAIDADGSHAFRLDVRCVFDHLLVSRL